MFTGGVKLYLDYTEVRGQFFWNKKCQVQKITRLYYEIERYIPRTYKDQHSVRTQ